MTHSLTTDDFLTGRVKITQPSQGFRAGIDAVLLASAIPAQPGQTVLELGCGVGTASLCLNARVPELTLVGVELQQEYAILARQNAARAGANMTVINADLRALPSEVRGASFDHVFANPPYYSRNDGTGSSDAGRDVALAGQTPLKEWVDIATRRLRPGGGLTVIQQADRLPDLLSAIDGRLGAVELLPLLPREGRPAKLILMRAFKGRRTPFSMRAPLVLHEGARHLRDEKSYRPEVENVLRNVAALPGFSKESV